MLADKASPSSALSSISARTTPRCLLLGLFRVVVGAAIVLIHNVWTRGFWPLVVTLTGWAMLVRGMINLFLPPEVMAALLADAHATDFYYVYASIPLVLGAYLTLRGFSATAPFETVLSPPDPGR